MSEPYVEHIVGYVAAVEAKLAEVRDYEGLCVDELTGAFFQGASREQVLPNGLVVKKSGAP